jgi:hypothetical protein
VPSKTANLFQEPRSADVAASLAAELDTEWAPDPWRWADLRFRPADWMHRSAVDDELSTLVVPFVGGRPRVAPLLGVPARIRFQIAATEVTAELDSCLSPTVLAYRVGADRVVEHYRTALARRRSVEQAFTGEFEFVGLADIERFFLTVRFDLLRRVLSASSGWSALASVLSAFTTAYGHPLVAGHAAARALANFALLPVDGCLQSRFTRWVDDYRVYSHSEEGARAAIEALTAGAARVGLSLNHAKSVVLPSREVFHHDYVSVVSHSDLEATPYPVSPDFEIQDERRLRLALRLATQNRDDAWLRSLATLDPTVIPASALPRLTTLLATCPWTDASTGLVENLLTIDDDYANWRALRLAYALWYAPSDAMGSLLKPLRLAAERCDGVRHIAARVFARHAPEILWDLGDVSRSVSWLRSWTLGAIEAGFLPTKNLPPDIVRIPPPITSYL